MLFKHSKYDLNIEKIEILIENTVSIKLNCIAIFKYSLEPIISPNLYNQSAKAAIVCIYIFGWGLKVAVKVVTNIKNSLVPNLNTLISDFL